MYGSDPGEFMILQPPRALDVRRCGSCTMCCFLPELKELNKPLYTWCTNCAKGVGCSIYEERPQACKDYTCLYLSDEALPEKLRPDHCKVIFEKLGTEQIYIAQVHPAYAEVWKRNRDVTNLITKLLRNGFAVVVTRGKGKQTDMILPKNRTEEQVWDGIKRFANRAGVTRE